MCFTGFGKTFMGIVAIRRVLNAKPDAKVIVVVPSAPVAKQWKADLAKCTTAFEDVSVLTSKIASRDYAKLSCNLLVIDEIHTIPTAKSRYVLHIPHNIILGLTATFERLDGGHKLIERFAPVIDTITLSEGVNNGWTANHNVYCVLCDVDDMSKYNKYTNIFKGTFEFFGYDFNAPMMVLSNSDYRDNFVRNFVDEQADLMGIRPGDRMAMGRLRKECFNKVMGAAKAFMESMNKRKNFIYHHPKKLEIAEKIIKAHQGKKGMTFWCTIEDAERVKEGKVYASVGSGGQDDTEKRTKKKNEETIRWFKETDGALINTVRALNTGFDVPEIEYGIMAGFNSSKTSGAQSRGRIVRINDLTKNKKARIFYVVLRDCNDQVWFANCIGNAEYLTILEEDLDDFLAGKNIEFAPNQKVKGSRY